MTLPYWVILFAFSVVAAIIGFMAGHDYRERRATREAAARWRNRK